MFTSSLSCRCAYAMRSVLALALSLATVCGAGCGSNASFDGAAAWRLVEAQCALGPRVPGSVASARLRARLRSELARWGWDTDEHCFLYRGVELCNVVARRGHGPLIIVGAHYDTRARADRGANSSETGVPGANDGASGVAMDAARQTHEVWLVFFDGEDQGDLNGWPWAVGASEFAAGLEVEPESVIIVDMVGDRDQALFYERSSTPWLMECVWAQAAEMGFSAQFRPEYRHGVIDDHTPFLQRGMAAVDIIDFDYAYWHTTADTPDKVSPASLERVGRVLEAILEGHSDCPAMRGEMDESS